MNVSKRKKTRFPAYYANKKATVKYTVGVQTAVGPVPLKASVTVETSTQTSGQGGSKSITSSNDICSQSWKATLYKPMPQYIYNPATINYTQFIHPPTGKGYVVDEGSQYVMQPYKIFPLGDFIDGQFSGSGAVSTVQSGMALKDNIFSLDINKKSTDGIGETPFLSNVSSQTKHMYLKSVKLDHQWVNASSNPLMFDVYWLLCMKNSHQDPMSQWTTQLEYERQGQNNCDTWNMFQANPVAGKPNINIYGQSPTTIKGFNDFWKLIKKEHFVLQAGGRCNTYTKFQYNYLASEAIMKSFAKGYEEVETIGVRPNYIAGVSIVPLVVVKGYGIYNNVVNWYAYSGGQFGVLTKQEYSFVPVQLEEKFPYNRVYPSAWQEGWNPAREQFVAVQDYQVEAPSN